MDQMVQLYTYHYLQYQQTFLPFAFQQLMMTLWFLQVILKDGNQHLRPHDSCIIKIHELYLTFLVGTSKVVLSQGRFTFQHDSVLRITISNVRSFYKNIKSTVPLSKQPIKMKSVKKGTKVKNKKQKFFPQWDLIGCCYRIQVAQAKQGKRNILVELTCPKLVHLKLF